VLLPHHAAKGGWAVFAGWNDEILHKRWLQRYPEKPGFGSQHTARSAQWSCADVRLVLAISLFFRV